MTFQVRFYNIVQYILLRDLEGCGSMVQWLGALVGVSCHNVSVKPKVNTEKNTSHLLVLGWLMRSSTTNRKVGGSSLQCAC